ncbi:MAG: TetR/AcrR family transcriptional regulator [Myxococcota bacterium]|nr:TetR/AcrR family transcriptional regulator [Myxococcota bacterium]
MSARLERGAQGESKRGADAGSDGEKGRMRFPGVRAPKPLVSRETERQLSPRQLEIIDELEEKLADGRLADLTMAEIAAGVSCSLRTLYGIAPSKDELLLTIVDRRLHRIGRAAIEAMDESMRPLEALRTYLQRANEAVQPESVVLASDLANVRGGGLLMSSHESYLIAVAKSLLDRAVAEGEIAPVDTGAVAHVLGSLGREFSQPDVAAIAQGSPKETADAVAELLFLGLQADRPGS